MNFVKRTAPWLLALTLLAALLAQAQAGLAQGPQPRGPNVTQGKAISYQGQLKRDGSQYTGACNFQFSLWDALNAGNQQGTTQSAAAVDVNNGLFGVSLDFGNQFQGEARWLETSVQCAGDAGFTTLTPRTALGPVPYALSLAPGAVISGTGALGLQVNAPNGNAIVGTGNANGFAAVYGGDNSPTGGYGVAGQSAHGGAGVYGSSPANGYGVWGVSSSSHGVVGSSTSGRGVWGYSGSGVGVYAQSDTGNAIVAHTGTDGYATIYGEDSSANGGYGVYGTSSKGSGVFGNSTNGVGVRGASTNGFAMRADGNATQSLNAGGWAKAMIFADPSQPAGQEITRCYNSQATGSQVYTPPCGFSSSNQGGQWAFSIPFDVTNRFVAATVQQSNCGAGGPGGFHLCVINAAPSGNWVYATTEMMDTGLLGSVKFVLIIY